MSQTPDAVVGVSDLAASMKHVGLPDARVSVDGNAVQVYEPVMGVVARVFSQGDGSWTVEAWDIHSDDGDLVALAAETIWVDPPAPTVTEHLYRADIPRVDAVSVWLEIEKQRPWCRKGDETGRSFESMNAEALAVSVWQQLAVAQIVGSYQGLLDRCPGLWLNFVEPERTSTWQAEGLWFGHQVNFYYSSGGGRLTIGGPAFDPSHQEPSIPSRDGSSMYWEASQSWPDPVGMSITPAAMTDRFVQLVEDLVPVAYPYLFPVLSRVEAERLSVGVSPWLDQNEHGSRERVPVVRWACGTELQPVLPFLPELGHPFRLCS